MNKYKETLFPIIKLSIKYEFHKIHKSISSRHNSDTSKCTCARTFRASRIPFSKIKTIKSREVSANKGLYRIRL